MSGEEFRREMADRMKFENNTYTFRSPEDRLHFHNTVANTIIMHRCNPVDKQMFIAGLREDGCSVAMTGDSVSDALGLREADVGMCVDGCDVAKDASDLIMRDS